MIAYNQPKLGIENCLDVNIILIFKLTQKKL